MRKELLITKRILAGMAVGLVLFGYAAIPVYAKRINPEDDPKEVMDVPYTDSNGESYYDLMGGYGSDLWAEQPFDAYWHNEGFSENSDAAKKYGKTCTCMNQDMYYSGYAFGRAQKENPKVTSDMGRQVVFGIKFYTDDPWKMTLLEEKTEGNTVNIVYQINAHTGDAVTVSALSYLSGTANAVALERVNSNKTYTSKNAPEYDPEWTIEPNDYFAFYSNIHTARRDGNWIEGCEEYTWPEEYGDAYISGLDYTIQSDDDVVYADSRGRIKFINYYTGVTVDADINYRYRIVNLDNVNNAVLEDTSTAMDTAGEDEGTDITSDIVEGDDFVYEEESDDEDLWSDFSSLTDDLGNPLDDLDIDEEELPKAVGSGAAGAATAAGAIGAAGAAGKATAKKKTKKKEKKEEKKEDKRSTYKMYVYKDFGDTLKRGDDAKYVYARIEETTWDKRVFNNDKLTGQISVSSPTDALIVSDGGMTVNGYKAAEVLVPKEGNKTKGTVSFRFTGEGGVYTRNVVFNIVGEKPYIIYPKLSDDGASWLESNQPGEAVFIAGQGGEEKVMFYIKDAVDEPIDIRFDAGADFDVSYEKEANYKCGYYAVVKNLSQEMEKANDIIADMVTRTIGVEAKFKDGMVASSEFYVELYPDGLSVVPNTKYFKDDRLQVNTVEEQNPKPGEIRLMPSSFDVLVCYMDSGTQKAKIFSNPSLKCGEIDDEGRYKNLFRENFLYWIDYTVSGGYSFYPKNSLPMFDEPFKAKMKLTYEGKDGSYYDGYLPIDFIGMKPDLPSKVTREQAINQLKKAIRLFGLGNNEDITNIVRNTSIHSAAQIQFATRYILTAGIDFYMDCSSTYTSFAKQCDRYIVVCGCMVKAGDMAIEYMLKVKFGKAGETAATFLNPLKNMYFEYIGQYYGVGADPETYKTEDFEFWKAIGDGASDKLEGMLTGEEKPTPENLGYVVAGYLMVRFVYHYYYGEGTDKGDLYRSLFAAIGDLSFMQFREWVGGLIKKWSGSAIKKLQEWLGQHFTEWYEGAASAAVKAAGDKGFEKVMRDNVKTGIGYAERDAARLARISAEKIELESVYKLMGWSRENYVKGRMDDLDIMAGVALNYMFGGTGKDGDVEDIKASDYAKKAISNFFCKVLGFEIENIYQVTENITGFSSFRVGPGNTIIFGFKNFEVEISVVKNLEIISNMLFGYCFSWLEKIYEYCTDDSAKIPDRRDLMECNTKILDEVLEIVENPDPIVYRDKK